MKLISSIARDLDEPVARPRVEAGGFRVEDDLTHPFVRFAAAPPGPAPAARADSSPPPVSITVSARRRFSASGTCLRQYGGKLRLRHAGPGQHAGLLHRFRCRHDHDVVDLAVEPGLEQERDVEHHHGLAASGGFGQESAARLGDQRMHDRFEPLSAAGIGQHAGRAGFAIDHAVHTLTPGKAASTGATAAPR